MDFWFVTQILLRTLLVSVASVMAILYIMAQFFQKIPSMPFRLKTYDFVVYITTACLYGFGLNSYWGLLAFVPLLIWKWAAHHFLTKGRLTGSGKWLEVQWQKLNPKGYTNVPKEALMQITKEIERLPNDTHFIIPRFFASWIVKLLLKRSEKDIAKMSSQLQGREQEALGKMKEIGAAILKLDPGKSERFSFIFGVLKVTRL